MSLSFLSTLLRIVKTLRSGVNVGDVALLKLTLIHRDEVADPTNQKLIEHINELNWTPINFSELSQMPEGSLGKTYYEFMLRNKLKPFNFSADLKPVAERFPRAFRYARIHDLVHVILGFETDLAGELGVYAFAATQKHAPFLSDGFKAGRIVTRLLKPWAWKVFAQAELRGKLLTQDAKNLSLEPLENYFKEDLNQLRKQWLPKYF